MKTIVKRSGCNNRAFGKLEDGTVLTVTREMAGSFYGMLRYGVNGKQVRNTGTSSKIFNKYLTSFAELARLTA